MLIEVIERERHGTPLKSEKFMKTPFGEPELIFDWRGPGEGDAAFSGESPAKSFD